MNKKKINELNVEPKGNEMFLTGRLHMNTSCTVETSKLTLPLQKVRIHHKCLLCYVVLCCDKSRLCMPKSI